MGVRLFLKFPVENSEFSIFVRHGRISFSNRHLDSVQQLLTPSIVPDLASRVANTISVPKIKKATWDTLKWLFVKSLLVKWVEACWLLHVAFPPDISGIPDTS